MPSSAIAWYRYDEEDRRLLVGFRGAKRRSYAYLDVPPSAFEELDAAPSKGIYINTRIKPFYDYEELSSSSPSPGTSRAASAARSRRRRTQARRAPQR
jgi:hypothetical protein